MSSTNKTTNYELSQFIGADKPAWLGDYNSDMSKIDAGIHAAQGTATGADGKADANATAIGTLSNLSTTAKNNLVAAINEVDTNADTAQGTANDAAGTATAAKTTADGIATYLDINNFNDATIQITGGNIDTGVSKIRYALNSDGTLGKVYGRFRYTASVSTGGTLTIGVPSLNVSSAITIDAGLYLTSVVNGVYNYVTPLSFTINTNGTITVTLPNVSVGAIVQVWFPPCLYLFKNFGD